MRKLKLYLDTTIFNMALSDQVPEYRDLSARLLNTVQAGKYEGYISRMVLLEISRAPQKKRDELLGKVKQMGLEILENHTEIDILAGEYVKAGLIPVKDKDDAVHIAMAAYYDLDAIISWNFEHMVKFKTKKGVYSVNALMGYKPLEIISPLEVSEDD